MAQCRVLQNDGTYMLQNDATYILLNSSDCDYAVEPPVPPPVGIDPGASGGKSTQQGTPLMKKRLGDRPHFEFAALAKGKLTTTSGGETRSSLLIHASAKAESIIKRLQGTGLAISKILHHEKYIAKGSLVIRSEAKAESYIKDAALLQHLSSLKETMTKSVRLAKLKAIIDISEKIESLEKMEPLKSYYFEFHENTKDELLHAFTHSSTFIGNVQYNPDQQSMKIIINGKTYNFCNVPERIFDAFEGAGSKGAFFAREIKGLFNC